MHDPTADERTLFPTPQLTRASIPLLDIEQPQLGGARSLTRSSLESFGQLTDPIVQDLYPLGEAPVGARPRYKIIDGHRRIHDLREINPQAVIQVRILPFEVGDATASAIALSLNYHRTHNPLAEAHHFDALRREGLTVEQIAKDLRISRGKIDRRLLLIDRLHPLIRAMLEQDEVAVTVAERCARLSFDRQQAIALDVLDPNDPKKLTHEVVSGALRAIRQASLPDTRPMFSDDAEVKMLRLSAALNLVFEDLTASHQTKALEALEHVYPNFAVEAPDDHT